MMADLTPEQREERRLARKASRRHARIRRAHERAARFTEDSLTSDERDMLALRDFVFHGVVADDEGLAYVALARTDDGDRLEAMGFTPESAISHLVRLARQ